MEKLKLFIKCPLYVNLQRIENKINEIIEYINKNENQFKK